MKSKRFTILTATLVVALIANMIFVGTALAGDTFVTNEISTGLITGPSATNWYFSNVNDRVAYCLDVGAADPDNTYYGSTFSPSNALKWILYNGYPNHTTIGGVALTSDEARQATQAAVWALQSGLGIGAWHANGSHQPDSGLAYAAAVYLFDNCTTGTLPSGGVSLTNPANADVQPYDSTYVRVGPYRATANYQMTSLAVSVTGITGYMIGNASGIAISPTNGTDFYIYLPIANMTSATSANLRVTANYRDPVWYCYSAHNGYQGMGMLGDPINTQGYRDTTILWSTTTGRKIDADNNASIAGAKFELRQGSGTSGAVVRTGTTNSAGEIDWGGLPFGTYTMIETAPASGYMTPKESNQTGYQTFTLSESNPHLTQNFINWRYRVQSLVKLDSENTTQTIADAEFTLYKATSVVGTSTPVWNEVQKLETDADGVIDFKQLSFGDYKIIETRPNPAYAEPAERGQQVEYPFTVDETTKGNHLLQVLSITNDKIRISVQVEKHTIDVTSAAYRSLPDEAGIDNSAQGTKELYRYDVNYRSLSNVRADELTVVDNLEGVAADQIRVQKLYTPICWGDTDGKMNIWVQTSLTETATAYSTVSAEADNPYNVNNPDNERVTIDFSQGWKLWAQDVPTSGPGSRICLDIDDPASPLNLKPGEYITKIAFEHGSVEKGFTTCNTETVAGDDWTPHSSDQYFDAAAADASDLAPVTYFVYAPDPMQPMTGGTETVIPNSVDAYIARNIVLKDQDADAVETRVIPTFAVTPAHPSFAPYDKTLSEGTGLGNMGDSASPLTAIILILVGAFVVLLLVRRSSRPITGGDT